ncbi:MAG: GGDEF domain-containing protein [Clostridia bacterium]|nr:GGDEF domain-containing protein [Clostridia bacterium]
MSTIIHVELDVLCFLILAVIGYQITRSVSKQMNRVLFRALIYGIMFSLALDIVWVLTEGRIFPGAVILNKLINALYLGVGVILGCIWYLYVLETLGYKVTRLMTSLVMLPGIVFMVLNIISLWTGWIFTVTPENVYVHGPGFPVQNAGALFMLFLPMVHIVIRLLNRKEGTPRWMVWKLLLFYIPPVVGTLIGLPYVGMPGTWTCAAVSIVLMYIDDQDREILRDSLTGLNNRKTLENVFEDYVRQTGDGKQLFLFMMDLDNFKGINDTLGHSVGDRALVQTAELLTGSLAGMKAYIARFGGDEFLVMSFFGSEEEAREYKEKLTESFREYNEKEKLPYLLRTSIGFSRWQPGQSLAELTELADGQLYEEKAKRKRKRKTGPR